MGNPPRERNTPSIVLVAALALTVLSQTRLWQRVTGRTLPKAPD